MGSFNSFVLISVAIVSALESEERYVENKFASTRNLSINGKLLGARLYKKNLAWSLTGL
jgi:hypothetical protein